MDFFPTYPVPVAISKVAFFFTTTALLQGVSNFFWVPLTNKFGRRPVYLTSYTIYFICCLWLIFEKSYGGFLAGRILIGVGAGAAETIAPVSIADVFFLHERGFVMSYVDSALYW
jgi:MFS family permease